MPAIFSALLDVPIGGNDISSLDFAICGAAPMPAKLIEVFEAKTGLRIAEGYGLTEGTSSPPSIRPMVKGVPAQSGCVFPTSRCTCNSRRDGTVFAYRSNR